MIAIGKSMNIISFFIIARSSTNVAFHGSIDAMSTMALKFVADTEAVSIKSLFEGKFEYKSDLYSDYTSMLSREIRTGPFGVHSGFHMKKSYDGPIKTPNIVNPPIKYLKLKPIDLTAISKLIISQYMESIMQKRHELGFEKIQLRFRATHKTLKRENFANFDEIVKNRYKTNYYGIVYEIVSPSGSRYGGLSTVSLSKRWYYAVKNAMQGYGRANPRQFDQEIYDFLFEHGTVSESNFKKSDGSWDWGKIFAKLNKHWAREVVRVSFSQKSLLKAERDFITGNNLIDDGLNMRAGGSIGSNKMDLPIMFIAMWIGMGLNIQEIVEELKQIGWDVSDRTVNNRIRDYFGNFEEAQILFLRPVLELLIKNNFELYEINDAYGRFMNERIKAFFGGKTYGELLEIINNDWSELFIARQGNARYWAHGGVVEEKLSLITIFKILEDSLLPKQVTKSIAHSFTFYEGMTSESIREHFSLQVRNQIGFDTWVKSKDYFMSSYIIKEYRNWVETKEPMSSMTGRVWTRYGYSSSIKHNQFSRRVFNGLNTEQAIEFLKAHPSITNLREFKKVFFSESRMDRDLQSIDKTILDSYLLKYTSISLASEDLSISFDDMTTLVEKFYKNWASGRNLLVANAFIRFAQSSIKKMSTQQIYNFYKSVGYRSVEHHNKHTRRLFNGRFSSTAQAILFFQKNPNIKEYSFFSKDHSESLVGSIL